LLPYFLSKTLVELPHQVIFPLIQAGIIYPMCGFRNDAGAFLNFFLLMVLIANCGNSLGIFFASVFSSLQVALAVTPMALLPLMIFSGLFVNNDTIPPYFDWIKYLSPIKYGFEGLVKNEFKGWSAVGAGGRVVTGDQAIANFGFADDGLTVSICALILFGMYLGLLLLAYWGLRRSAFVRSSS
jgi:ABC-type multidrug transport system permease subunit